MYKTIKVDNDYGRYKTGNKIPVIQVVYQLENGTYRYYDKPAECVYTVQMAWEVQLNTTKTSFCHTIYAAAIDIAIANSVEYVTFESVV